jgi:cytochrome c
MKKLLQVAMLVLSILGLNIAALAAAEQGSADEASAMVKKAVAYLKTNGKEKTLAEASNHKGQFIDRDLYLSIYDLS